jgi:tellurite resistance protein TerC
VPAYSTEFWISFHVGIALCLFFDLFVFHRTPHAVSIREAAIASAAWVALALVFCGWIYHDRGRETAVVFLAAYTLEKSLSLDNLFVFYLLFRHFGIRKEDEHRLLFFGVVGAILMRAVFIYLGVALVQRFHAALYVFGAMLIWSGIGMLRSEHTEEETEGRIVAFLRRHVTIAPKGTPGFFVVRDGRWMATTSGFALLAIELTDLVFAVDSIPAVLALTQEFFIAYTSNIFAILGLRALYFLLAGAIGKFRRLHYGLSIVLVFIGGKMIVNATGLYHLPIEISLAVIFLSVGGCIAWDLCAPARPKRRGLGGCAGDGS